MNRINQTFKELEKEKKTALITFVVAGDPALDTTEEIILAKIEGGADIIEMGIPFSDPLADGPVIQASASRSLKSGTTIKAIFEMARNIRKKTEIPLVFLVYYNMILQYGTKRFINECYGIIDGLIIPDLPFEEQKELIADLDQNQTALIPLIAPTSKNRIKDILENHKEHGFVYCVTTMGVTGIDVTFHKDLETYLRQVKEVSQIPVCAGFGVKDKEDVRRLSGLVDGVIIGSAIVNQIDAQGFNKESLRIFIEELKK